MRCSKATNVRTAILQCPLSSLCNCGRNSVAYLISPNFLSPTFFLNAHWEGAPSIPSCTKCSCGSWCWCWRCDVSASCRLSILQPSTRPAGCGLCSPRQTFHNLGRYVQILKMLGVDRAIMVESRHAVSRDVSFDCDFSNCNRAFQNRSRSLI